MPVTPNNYVTPSELENNYEFKLMKKVLRQEYPWILDILVPKDEDINKWNLIFLPIVIDPFMLQKEVGLPIEKWIRRYLTEDKHQYMGKPYAYVSSYISTMFKGDREITQQIHDEVEKVMRSVEKSAAIPNDLKLGKGRAFSVAEYIIPEMDIPEDAYFVGD